MTTNNRVIQRTMPIIAPAMIPTDEPSSSLLPCVSVALVLDTTGIIVVNTVGIRVTMLLPI